MTTRERVGRPARRDANAAGAEKFCVPSRQRLYRLRVNSEAVTGVACPRGE